MCRLTGNLGTSSSLEPSEIALRLRLFSTNLFHEVVGTEIYRPTDGDYRCVMRLFTGGIVQYIKVFETKVLVLYTMFCCNKLWRLETPRNGTFTELHIAQANELQFVAYATSF
jgi:hypothetical protein